MNKKLYFELIFLVILGAITSLSLPPINYLVVNFFTFSSFFIFLNRKLRQHKSTKLLFFIYGWLFGFGYFMSNLYWISISLTFDQNYKFLIPFTIVLIPAFLALFYGCISCLFFILKPKKIVISFLIFSLIFGILEFIRGSILTGFPWNLVVYSFSNQLEFLSVTSIIGTYGLNLFCISLFTSPAIFILRDTKKDIAVFIFFLISVLIFYIYGSFYKDKFNIEVKKNLEYKIRVIGSNINLDRFYEDTEPVSIVQDLIKLSNPVTNEKTIFIWPEGALPEILQEDFVIIREAINNKFSENHLLIIGTNTKSEVDGKSNYFNSLSIYNNELKILDSYDKINLVPFGEFLPFENILKIIGLKSLTNNYQSFSAGNQRNIIEIKKQNFSLKILPLICYEIIYSGKLFNSPDFDLIINISEDGWFGDSIGPKQHFVHSIFRAIETGTYVLRSANNGIAAIINPLGEIENKVDFSQTGYVDLTQRRQIQPTIFSKYGNNIFGLLILLYIFLIFSFNKFRNE